MNLLQHGHAGLKLRFIYYPPAFVLSRFYAFSLKRKWEHSPRNYLDSGRIKILLKVIKAHLHSPKRNGHLNLIKDLLAAYFITPGDTVIDAGAHVGKYTLYYSSLVGKKGHVHAYEAHPQIFQKLKNKFENYGSISTHHFVVSNQSDSSKNLKIYPDELHFECATVEEALMNDERMPGRTEIVSVPCQALNVLCRDLSHAKCSFIKIDVEGHEHAVIDGASELIQKHKPIVIYEYGHEPGKFEARTIEQMNQLGYISYDCQTLKIVHPGFISLNPTDLVAIPLERIQEFEELTFLL